MTTVPPPTYTPDPDCECGCEPRQPNGKIVSSHSCRGSSVWTLTAPRGKVIKLQFEHLVLNPDNLDTRLIVRDGENQMSDLLVNTYGRTKPSSVVSTQRTVLIEFLTSYHKPSIYQGRPEQFVAIYTSMGEAIYQVILLICEHNAGSMLIQILIQFFVATGKRTAISPC